ncbi:MAG: hypothetical protein U0271_33280 [Polyangiaceae bacterium]
MATAPFAWGSLVLVACAAGSTGVSSREESSSTPSSVAAPESAASSASPSASSRAAAVTADWSITLEISNGVDFGNGVIQSTSDVTETFTPEYVDVVEDGTRRGAPDTHATRRVPLDPARRAAIEAAIPDALALCGNYAIAPGAPDEGWDTERLAVRVGSRTCAMDLSGDSQKPPVPAAVTRLLRALVVPPQPR